MSDVYKRGRCTPLWEFFVCCWWWRSLVVLKRSLYFFKVFFIWMSSTYWTKQMLGFGYSFFKSDLHTTHYTHNTKVYNFYTLDTNVSRKMRQRSVTSWCPKRGANLWNTASKFDTQKLTQKMTKVCTGVVNISMSYSLHRFYQHSLLAIFYIHC